MHDAKRPLPEGASRLELVGCASATAVTPRFDLDERYLKHACTAWLAGSRSRSGLYDELLVLCVSPAVRQPTNVGANEDAADNANPNAQWSNVGRPNFDPPANFVADKPADRRGRANRHDGANSG